MFSYNTCPSCGEKNFKHFLNCKDYTVSKETFSIVECINCGLRFTNPIPDLKDLGKYYLSEDYISHSDTKKGLVSKLYHLVRNYTLKSKVKLLASYVSRGTILDYGCGTGAFLKTALGAGWNTFGIEPDAGARALAQGGSGRIFENKQDLIKSHGKQKFTAITLWHVLEHVTDLEQTASFFKERLESNGVLIIAVPNHTSGDAVHYREHWAAYDVPRHLYHFEPRTIEQLLNKSGFTLIETRPMKFDSFYVSMLSEKYKTGSIKYFKAFWQGLSSNLKAGSASGYSSVIYIFKAK